ncbi:iron-containing redox enzyme family protein [Rhodococcoides fascians]|uniref:iron-containing redox enzyme family protein n=1 Tax=Rhodococcoides fascians TaxID=1828 RepID=UPI000B320504|nr:iron-containing redox enzyme family protein [Rhodococcus fascians]
MTELLSARPTAARSPVLPVPCGPISEAVVRCLTTGEPGTVGILPTPTDVDSTSRDVQLALLICYELHYRGFDGVADAWEWDPELLRLRATLESAFLEYVRAHVEPGHDAAAEMDSLSVEATSGTGPSWFLRDEGSWEQMREYFVHRSIYHLKEADPHAWAIPRLTGQAKASYVAVEFDEYGGGKGDRVHQKLWADSMVAAELDASYLGYVDRVPAQTLAWVNLMSLFGLHRGLRGATVGHLAATEITSSPGSQRYVHGLKRLKAPQACIAFYAEHVEADAVHEQVLRHDVVGNLLRDEPELEADVVFGMRALDFVENELADHVMSRWSAGRSSLD